MDDRLTRLGLAAEDRAAIEGSAAPPEEVEPLLRELRMGMGLPARVEHWPDRERLFYPHVFVAAVPDILAYHETRGIPEAVSWRSLLDLGRNMERYRAMHGRPGLDEQDWLRLHWRGLLYELGRLQFERLEDGTLGIHIPGGAPLDPDAVAASLAAARQFFDRHFPESAYRTAVCKSWLLDPQLGERLPASSNIARFQRLFELDGDSWEGDDDVFKFVFRRVDPALDELPQNTTLEQALVAHLRAGGHWRVRRGRLALPA